MSDERRPFISEKSTISIAVFGTLSAGLVMVGIYINKIDNLEKMKIPDNFASIRSDLSVIKMRLGIAVNRESEQMAFSAKLEALLQSKVAARAEGIRKRQNTNQIAVRMAALRTD